MDSCFRKKDNGGREWIPEAGMTKRTSMNHRETLHYVQGVLPFRRVEKRDPES